MISLLYIFKFQLIEYGVQGIDPPSKTAQGASNVVSMLNNSATATGSTSFKTITMTSAGSANASPVAKLGTPTRVSCTYVINVIMRDFIMSDIFFVL